ncbi:exo-alpha-sialidase [Flagellimonas hymeniacidonis]|uniref:Exo-alpha-sialidase n=1 Tax=Flagellimonas hymeniacidonis TaxID=2603628 RepID=A0A5C8V5Y1_9FLAO|nr:PD40 domain-containing protein [Flagellimonas hymeniacidonis]TXN37255.1 exo-alpha-sialidase [Flagellimonas hymeniacidonis]
MDYLGYKRFICFLAVLGLQACFNNGETELLKDTRTIDLKTSPATLELFGDGIISTGLNERDLAISPDKKELYYTLGTPNDGKRAIIKMIKTNQGWGQQEIASFSGKHNDIEPFISPDGSKFFFCSDRPMDTDSTRSDYNIWVMNKSVDGWGQPSPLNEKINTTGNEFYPSVSKNGNLYFTASKPKSPGREDIYISKYIDGEYLDPIPLDTTVNSKTFEFNAFVSPNEDILIFSSYGRADDLGGGDLYMSIGDSLGNWQKARNLGLLVNSEGLDFCPFIDFENETFYFTSNRLAKEFVINDFNAYQETLKQPKNGAGDIYRINLEKVLNVK